MTHRHLHPPEGIVGLVRHGFLDAELAATAWLLVEGGCPIVIGDPGAGVRRGRLLDAFLEALRPGTRRVDVTDLEPSDGNGVYAVAGDLGSAPRDLVVGATLQASPLPGATEAVPVGLAPRWDFARGRAVAGALSVLQNGVGLGVAVAATSLEEVLAFFRSPAIRVADDRLSFLGLVLVADDSPDPSTGRQGARVLAAHYLRPIARDAGGHVQRPGPAVLATWDAAAGRFEHFGWGVAGDLAARVGMATGDFERELAHRQGLLTAAARSH